MALVNYTLPFGSVQSPAWATVSPVHSQHASAVNNLLYGPAGHQEGDPNDHGYSPYGPPQQQPQPKQSPQQPQHQHSVQYRQAPRNNYLPPPAYVQQPQGFPPVPPQSQAPGRTYGEGSYAPVPPRVGQPQPQPQPQQQQQPAAPSQPKYYNGNNSNGGFGPTPSQQPGSNFQPLQPSLPQNSYRSNTPSQQAPPAGGRGSTGSGGPYPERPPDYGKPEPGQGSRTQVHTVFDYDDDEDDYYDVTDDGTPVSGFPDNRKNSRMPGVTPIQGPIFVKNGTVPVVPLFAYPQVTNGTFVQIPIWWTAISLALGLDVRGDVITGVPCIKRYHQLFCPTAGNTYPIDRIETFIDENKALMKRMYGDFEMSSRYPPLQQNKKRKRQARAAGDDDDFTILPELMELYGEPGAADVHINAGDSYFSKLRNKRQSQPGRGSGRGGNGSGNGSNGGGGGSGSGSSAANGGKARQGSGPSGGNGSGETGTGRVDACESKIEIVTPYWASNSAGIVRAIVNTQHFEQAIHQEVCSKTQTSRCSGDCGCEQKYKWHRLLAYDPDNDCKGIFMDWFLFPSCCVCRCDP